MPVKNVECQLAEMQIGRYVSGDILSNEALKQLEVHVARCQSCSRILADRRKALNSMLTHGFAAVSTDIPSANKENLLIKALKEKAEVGTSKKAPRPTAPKASPEPPKKDDFSSKMAALLGGAPKATSTNTNKNLQKPLLYAAALAVVLLAMGYISRGQGSLLGENADSAFPPAVAPVAAKPKAKAAAAAPKTTTVPKPVSTTEADANAAEDDAQKVDDSVSAENGDARTGTPKNLSPQKGAPDRTSHRSGFPLQPPANGTGPHPTTIDKVGAGSASIAQPTTAQNSEPLDSSSIDNNANEPQLTPSSPRLHRSHRTIAAQERSPRHQKHRAHAAKPKAGKVRVYQPSTVQIYDESGNPLRS